MAADMNNIAVTHASIAINLERMHNFLSFNAEAEILEAINALALQVNNRLDAVQHNSVAQYTNGHANYSTMPLTPLWDSRNRDVTNFPADLAALVNMNKIVREVNQLLQAYGLPVVSSIATRRSELKTLIGIVVARM